MTGVAPGNTLIRFTVIEREHQIEYTSHSYVIVTSDEDAGVDSVIMDNVADDSAARYYNLNGVLVNPDNLAPGIYIRKQQGETKKILIK